jgi:hypothetical protein
VLLSHIEAGQGTGPEAAQDDERGATVGTGHLRWGGGGASRRRQSGAGLHGDHRSDGVGLHATVGVHKAKVSHLHEARWQDMLEEPAHQLKDVKASGARRGTSGFAVGEGDAAVLQADEAPVRDGDFEDVGREVFAGSGTMGSRLAVHVPGEVPDVGIDLGKLPGGAHRLLEESAGERRQGSHRDRAVGSCRQPCLTLWCESAARDAVVAVRMLWQWSAPGMQDASETGQGCAKEAWLFGEALESL